MKKYFAYALIMMSSITGIACGMDQRKELIDQVNFDQEYKKTKIALQLLNLSKNTKSQVVTHNNNIITNRVSMLESFLHIKTGSYATSDKIHNKAINQVIYWFNKFQDEKNNNS